MGVQYRFDDEVKDDAHSTFTPKMLKLPQATWIETFLEGVTDKNTGLPLFCELVWFTYKVSGVMCSVSVCEHCWSVVRESLDDSLCHLLPWDIELVIDEPVDEQEEEPEV